MSDESLAFLRTLAPLLRGLEKGLRSWLDERKVFPIPVVSRAEIEGVADDLQRKAEALDVEKPILVIMLMGGTGVGKSTLLNALAGDDIAQASFTRPTTRDPVVYFHHDVDPEKLDPSLRLCRLAQHGRDELRQKVLVDTPDIDSNDTANRDKLMKLLPAADVVLYVGSQEKYHDQIGWELFKAHRKRRAFAFVMNKWDRCEWDEQTVGTRPDQDLLNDLHAEGFANPKLFRTTAQAWLDARGSTPETLPEGEQFAELVQWLELGITRLEIEAVKARGVGQLLTHTIDKVESVRPPELSGQLKPVRKAWEAILRDEAEAQTDVLVTTLEPYQNEVEHHFSIQGHQRFRGLMAIYLRITTKLRYMGSSLRDRLPLSPKLGSRVETPAEWNLSEFIHACTQVAEERSLGQRLTALSNRLLIEADQRGYPLTLLTERTEETTRLDWQDRFTRALVDSLSEVEREATQPTGWRKYVRGTVVILGNVLPELALITTIILLLWRFFVEELMPTFFHVVLPIYVTLGVLVTLHILILLILPVRWRAIRGEFHSRLEKKIHRELEAAFLPLLNEIAERVLAERRKIEALRTETMEIVDWLQEREQAAQINELYGN